MTGLIDNAAAILSNSERRLQNISQNIANASTPSYKRQVTFSSFVENSQRIGDHETSLKVSFDNAPGKYTESASALDLAIVGPGLFMLRDGERYYYSRGGQFSRASDGTITDAQGMRLQQAGGGDLVVDRAEIEILGDGTVLADGAPVGSVGLYETADAAGLDHMGGSLFSAPSSGMGEAENSVIRQGVLEGSNVVLSDEMINLIANNRQAEMGGQLVRAYDQLIGQAITTFTRSSR